MAFVPNTLNNLPATSGRVFFVSSTGNSDTGGRASDGNTGRDPNVPMATIDAAIARCRANKGDMIVVMPGHAETVGASGITMDVAGVWIYGLGTGASRHTITFNATGSTLAMSAASTRSTNLRFALGIDNVVSAITITGANTIVEDCETVIHATLQFVTLLTATDAQYVVIRNNRFRGLHTASGTSGVVVDGCDDLQIIGNQISGHFTEHALDNTTPGSVDEILRATIADNFIRNDSTTAGDKAVDLDANATGMFSNNMLSGGLATTAANFSIGKMGSLESYVVDSAGDSVHGIALGTAAV